MVNAICIHAVVLCNTCAVIYFVTLHFDHQRMSKLSFLSYQLSVVKIQEDRQSFKKKKKQGGAGTVQFCVSPLPTAQGKDDNL